VDQVSKPVLIALATVLVFVVAHFTILAPKSDSGGSTPASATAPGQAGLQGAIDKANHAVGTNNAAVKRHEQAAAAASGDAGASGQVTTKPSVTTASGKAAAAKPAAPAKPKPNYTLEAGDRSGPILADLDRGKVVVALFYNPRGSDDNAALRAVRHADRHHGKVVLHSIPIDDVGDYNALTTGVQVLQAPTILVIGPDHKARTIVGYTEVKEVDQTVGDIGGKGFEAMPAKHLTGFIRKAVDVCDGDVFSITVGELPESVSSLDGWLTHTAKGLRHSRARMAKIPASGAKQVAAKKALLAAYGGYANTLDSAAARIHAGAQPMPTVIGMVRAGDTITKHYAPALRAVHDHHCLA
jgi:hypothetical protein